MLADFYARNGNPQDAIGAYRTLIKLSPAETGAYLNMAMLYEETGQNQNAVRCYETFVQKWRGEASFLTKAREALLRLKGK